MSVSPFDPATFWEEHDCKLDQHGNPEDVTLSHDLYRGMPAWFNAFFAYFQRRSVMRLLQECNYREMRRSLDVGCGTGRWSEFLLQIGLEPFGVDLGRHALQIAASRWPGAVFSCGRLPHLAFANASFEFAISVTVLQHIPLEQQPYAIREIGRILKPGGYFVACESIDASDLSPHIFGNARERWLALFGDTGFELIAQSACEYLPYIKIFHWLRDRLHRESEKPHRQVNVSQVARLLEHSPLLALGVRFFITVSYPLEYLASWLFPPQWARLACFLLRKPRCV